MLQLAVQDSSYNILHQAVQSEPEAYPAIWGFVTTTTVICTWLMLGLFVAVVTGTFERVRENYRLTRVQNALANEEEDGGADAHVFTTNSFHRGTRDGAHFSGG